MNSPIVTTFDFVSQWIIPGIIVYIVLYAYFKKVKVYESFVEGAKEGFGIAIMIIPYLVAILMAIEIFKASGAMEVFKTIFTPFTKIIGMPVDLLPLAIIRPLSGSGARGFMFSVFDAHGVDSFAGMMASVMQGSTETTFYILAVYFGAIGVKKTRHTLPACLLADVAGILASVFICQLYFANLK